MSANSIREIFFQECEDLSDALMDGLNEMADGSGGSETVNAVFRAVHSIKGSGGAFGLEDLVSFAHKFETVLDSLRSNMLSIDEKIMPVLLRAGDVLIDLIEAARLENEIDKEAVSVVTIALSEFIPSQGDAIEDELVFEPMALNLPEIESGSTELVAGFKIVFSPRRSFFEVGNDPLHLLKAVADLGKVKTTAHLDNLPDDLDQSDWESSYIFWTIEVETDEREDTIRAVFSFVEGVSDISFEKLNPKETDVLEVLELSPEAKGEPNNGTLCSGDANVQKDDKPAISKEIKSRSVDAFSSAAREAKATLRVDLDRVDRLINSVGELIINQSVIAQRIKDAGLGKSDEIQVDLDDYKHLAREIQEGVMAIRAQPVKPLFQRMARIVREVTSSTGKKVQLVTKGEGTEVDKTLVERLSDPLTHMIRNAIDHGIEDHDARVAAGKDPTGKVQLSAEHRSGNVLLEIKDDGAGLNRDRILKIAIEKGIVDEGSDLSNSEIDQLLFEPGFSTASEVTNLSGRGVGMDVVKTAISSLGGKIAISSKPGHGSTFSIMLPLTLAVMDGMVVDVGEQTMVIPISSISETIKPVLSSIFYIGQGNPVLRVRGKYVPIIDLAQTLGHNSCHNSLENMVFLLVVTERVAQCAFAVDRISDQRQVVIKSLQAEYGSVPGISAATILGDGKIALIVDPDGITSAMALLERSDLNRDKYIEGKLEHV